MTAKPPPLSAAPRPRFRLGRFLLKAFVAVLLVLLVWHISFRIRTNNAIKRLETKARANGEPWTLVEVAATYYGPIPDEENAAIPLMALWEEEDPELWKAFRDGAHSLPSRVTKDIPEGLPVFSRSWRRPSGTNGMKKAEAELMSAFIGQNSDHLDRLHQALQLRRARFPVKIENGHGALLPHLRPIMEESRLLRLECLHRVAEGDLEKAMRAVTANFRCADLLSDDPLLVSQLVRVACMAIAVASIEDVLNQVSLPNELLLRLARIVDQSQTTNLFQRAHVADRAVGNSVYLDPQQLANVFALTEAFGETPEEVRSSTQMLLLVMRPTGWLAADRAYYLEKTGLMIDHLRLGYPERLKIAALDFPTLKSEVSSMPPKMISGMLLPALGKSIKRQARLDAIFRCASTALAVERYRANRNGRLPENLDQLVPAFLPSVPIDPYDGLPLRYRMLGRGYTVYSVLDDRVDDGGKEKVGSAISDDSDEAETFDEAFTVTR